MTIICVGVGYRSWPEKQLTPPTAEEIAREVANQLPKNPKQIEKPTPVEKTKPEEHVTTKGEITKPSNGTDKFIPSESGKRPYFDIWEGYEIKTSPNLHAEISIKNVGKHMAINLSNRMITTDQHFLSTPTITDDSEGNEVPCESIHTYRATVGLPTVLNPTYILFAIKYEDKEIPESKTFSQIWCYRTGRWVKVGENTPPPQFYDASIFERQTIINHFKQELRDYLK